ncbi:unnamed protein product [Pieris macdunnoughi]|uniref:Uncharacterized protein n=1 Tax=Pieris macdunnoughi TaxID=345717 RepID=A0A821XIG5_9NEOP|nr:unnamed protein product [Pieris macdunnoughi]
MGSTNFVNKNKLNGFRAKTSSFGSDKDMNGKLKKSKIRRPVRMNDYGLKRIPDYTELAYKEAVSKLKYFLGGNNAPSLRSYTGSSLKNDDIEGDLDKKYPFNAITEYKPRPRLTAKYTTLYADSLNNYTPPQINTYTPQQTNNVPTPTNDLSGGTNPDVVNFIQKQEEYIEQLERESQYCRDELNNLLGKVKEVISENEHLHEAQKNKLITRMFNTYAGSETDDLDDVGDSTGLDSDNKCTPSKARKPKSRSTKLEGPNIVFESRIAELEAHLTQAKIDLKKVQEENNENKRKLASGLVDSTCLDGFKRQIDNLQRDKSSLESQISKLKLNLEQRDDGDDRYKRGDAIENQLREERNNLESEIRRLKDDLSKERNKVRELAGETARRAIHERSAAEQRYNQHFDELQHDLAAQYDNAAKLQLDLERQRREESELKRELSMKNAALEELKMELKNKTASLQADLTQAHAEKASLEEELANARLAIERNQRQAKHEANRLNSEIQSLRHRLDRSDADLVHSRRENLRLSEQISTLEKEINMKSLTPMTPEKKKKERELSTALESMENKHAKTVAELESMIQSQNSLMEKLTSECRLLTDKLDDANRRHKVEKTQLLFRNTELMRKLRHLWSSHKKYCTTIAPFRSYTPLSGYPASSDLDRTYLTSTPFTNRYRFRRIEGSNYSGSAKDFDELSKNLSDISLDRFDSDEDPDKRQVEKLGRSMQTTYAHHPSTQAPSSHTTTPDRIPNPTTPTRSNDTRAEPARESPLREDPTPSLGYEPESVIQQKLELTKPTENTEIEPKRILSKQSSHESNNGKSLHSSNDSIPPEPEHPLNTQVTEVDPKTEYNSNVVEEARLNYPEENLSANIVEETNYDQLEHSANVEETNNDQPQETEEKDENSAQNYEQGYQNYEQNYQNQPGTEYQGYDQQYSEQQYENYEQYPQQYNDPNAQYDNQFDYGSETNYQQNYDQQYNQEYNPQYEQNVVQENVETTPQSNGNDGQSAQS